MSKPTLTEQLLNNILQLRKLMLQAADVAHEEKAATMLQLFALNFLHDRPGTKLSSLGASLHLSKSSSTQLIERLEKMGFLKRAVDKDDKRIIHLSLRLKGERKLSVLRRKVIHKMNRIISKVPESDLKELVRIQSDLIKTLEKERK